MGSGAVSDKNSHLKWKLKNEDRAKEIQRKATKKFYDKNKDEILKKQREHRQYMKEEAACEIIKQHHEDMKDDPERLTTKFMKSIVNIECDD